MLYQAGGALNRPASESCSHSSAIHFCSRHHTKQRGWPTLCGCGQRVGPLFSFFSLLPLVHRYQSFSSFIKCPTAPRPIPRMLRQFLAHRIHMHVIQFLPQLLFRMGKRRWRSALADGAPPLTQWLPIAVISARRQFLCLPAPPPSSIFPTGYYKRHVENALDCELSTGNCRPLPLFLGPVSAEAHALRATLVPPTMKICGNRFCFSVCVACFWWGARSRRKLTTPHWISPGCGRPAWMSLSS